MYFIKYKEKESSQDECRIIFAGKVFIIYLFNGEIRLRIELRIKIS